MTIFQNAIIIILRNEIFQIEIIKEKGGSNMTINDEKYQIALANSGLKVKEVAERAGVSRARFHAILNSKQATPQAVGKIAKGLGVDVREIID